jgi:hypothetical protein
MKLCLVGHQKVVSAGLDLQSVFTDTHHKTASISLCFDQPENAQLAICMGEYSCVPHTTVRRSLYGRIFVCTTRHCQARLMLERAYVPIDSDCGRGSLTFGKFSRVCEMMTADQKAFYTRRSLRHTTIHRQI